MEVPQVEADAATRGSSFQLVRLLLVRHGQAVTNLTHAIGRNNSTPLTPTGEEQAQRLGKLWQKRGGGWVVDKAYASAAVRARHTAQLACGVAYGETLPIVVTDDIVEINRGEKEGHSAGDVFFGAVLDEYLRDPYHFRLPGGESEEEVEHRMLAFLNKEVIPELQEAWSSNKPHTVALFSHGCALRCLLRGIFGWDATAVRLELANTSVTELIYCGGLRFSLHTINDTQHLFGQ
eukprot:TRINITY_DN2574_c1_g1_i7.p1 TRINITY_DN2574_c1_g1~~TRINITY_DN2574_c1_g1_i7.p1  ORF type:complete len:235 (-),score=47.50 TRINITY_DN2574_c1_g1_i7:44-748(-)